MGWLLRAVVVFAFAVLLAQVIGGQFEFNLDYTVLWAAGRHAFGPVYDPQFITAAQSQFHYPGVRPFVYPPTMLLLMAPFGALPFAVSYPLWAGLSASAFVMAWERLVKQLAPFMLLSPIVIIALISGQSTLLVGAGLIGLSLLSRPILAGVLLGSAMSLKPQIVLLLPLGLLIGGHYRALIAMLATGAAWIALSALVFGPGLWLEWIRGLPGFLAYARTLGLTGVTPAWGLSGPLALAARLGGVGLGLCVIWWGFRTDEVAHRLVACVGASILCSPYAMRYELALMAPAALAFVAGRTWRAVPGAALLVGGIFATPALTAAFVALMCRPWSLPGRRVAAESA